jgi:putative membrane protein
MSEIPFVRSRQTTSEIDMHWHDMDGGDWAWMTTMMVLFWGLIAAAVIALVRRTGVADAGSRTAPEEMLRRRLAGGEIDVEEYQHRLDVLRAPTAR